MNNINLDRFNTELTLLQTAFTKQAQEAEAQQSKIDKDLLEIRRQREELIKKQNLILGQVTSMRDADERVAAKTLEAKKLKENAVAELEKAEKMIQQAKTREDELDLREKKVTGLEQREEALTLQLRQFESDKASLNTAQELLRKEQELLDEKQKVIVIRERKIDIEEAKIKRIYQGL